MSLLLGRTVAAAEPRLGNRADIAEKLQGEDGAEKAIKVIERVMANYVPRMPKVKKPRKNRPALKLVG